MRRVLENLSFEYAQNKGAYRCLNHVDSSTCIVYRCLVHAKISTPELGSVAKQAVFENPEAKFSGGGAHMYVMLNPNHRDTNLGLNIV